MPAPVKIKDGKYGTAIRMLLERGGSFQTRPERILIVTADQRKTLEDAELIETSEVHERSNDHAPKKKRR
jgi:hypothetical protein